MRNTSKRANSKTAATRAGLSATQPLGAGLYASTKPRTGQLTSKHQMIKRGIEDAEALSSFLPLFTKKVKDPKRAS